MYEKSLARTYKLIAHQYRAATDTKKIKMKVSSIMLLVRHLLTILVYSYGGWIL